MKSSPRNDAKRYIYRALARALQSDADNGSTYLHDLTTDSPCFSSYKGKKISTETLSALVKEITDELHIKAGEAPLTMIQRYEEKTKTKVRYGEHVLLAEQYTRIGYSAYDEKSNFIQWLGDNPVELAKSLKEALKR